MVKTLYKKRYNFKTKKKRGGAIAGLGVAAQTSGETIARTIGIAAVGATTTGELSTKFAFGTATSGITTTDSAVQGTLAVISAMFNTLITVFIKLPEDFDSNIKKLLVTANTKSQQLIKKNILKIFKSITEITDNIFDEILKEYSAFYKQVVDEIYYAMKDEGCSRGIMNKVFSNRMKFSSTCKYFTGNRLTTNMIIERIRNKLKKIKNGLRIYKIQIKQKNMQQYNKLKLKLKTNISDPTLLSFMDTYKKIINPLIEKTQMSMSSDNPDMITLLNQFYTSIKKPIIDSEGKLGITKRIQEFTDRIFSSASTDAQI